MTEDNQSNKPNKPGQQSLLYSKTGIIILLFVVLGPLGLPFLYRSNSFSKTGKIILTIAVAVYTLVVLAVFAWLIILILRIISQISEELSG